MATEATRAPQSPERTAGHPGGPTDPQTAATQAAGTQDEAATDEARAAAHFASDATTHKLTVHREDGVFRHVEFTGLAGLSRIMLVTWPCNLLVAGSHGSYHFERFGPDTEDMFNWLRGTRVNADSWASKLVNGRDSVTEYSREKLVTEVNERVQEALTDDWAPDGLVEAVAERVLGSHLLDQEATAFDLLSEFQHGMTYRAECSCGLSEDFEGRDSYSSAATWEFYKHKADGKKHTVKVRQTGGFDFDDFTEWDVRKLNYHYLWTCHAMVWAVRQYDAAKKAVEPDIFQVGHTYADDETKYDWKFRVDAITTDPTTGERTALGWRFFNGAWEAAAYPEDDWEIHQAAGLIDVTVDKAVTG